MHDYGDIPDGRQPASKFILSRASKILGRNLSALTLLPLIKNRPALLAAQISNRFSDRSFQA